MAVPTKVAASTELLTADGPLPVRNVSLVVERDGEVMRSARLHFTVAAETWRRIDQEQLFGLAPENRRVSAVDVAESETVEVEAACEPDTLTMAILHAEDEFDLGAMVRFGQPIDVLKKASSWRALYVKVPAGPGIKKGFATVFAD